MARVLVVVDMQHDFVNGHLSTPEARSIVGAVRAKIERVLREGAEVFFTLDTHLQRDYDQPAPSVEAAKLPPHCIKGTPGWAVIGELSEFVREDNRLEKPAFLGIELARALERYIADDPADQIELCGVCTDICVLSNALFLRQAFPRVRIAVDPACCAGTTPDAHRAALTVMNSCLIDTAG